VMRRSRISSRCIDPTRFTATISTTRQKDQNWRCGWQQSPVAVGCGWGFLPSDRVNTSDQSWHSCGSYLDIPDGDGARNQVLLRPFSNFVSMMCSSKRPLKLKHIQREQYLTAQNGKSFKAFPTLLTGKFTALRQSEHSKQVLAFVETLFRCYPPISRLLETWYTVGRGKTNLDPSSSTTNV
jgi:hypothetical protein